VVTPGSEFFHDVDVVLHSAVVEPKNQQEELNHSLER
jgi:hypothetical protein